MSTLNGQWIEVFRAGDYGDKGAYSAADLDQLIAAYDPAKHEAPVVVGHPENDAPAYGWVEALRRQGDVLMAKLKQVPAAFEQAVRDGRFKKRSVALYGDPLALRHVGFLGALPPEVKGLADIRLCEFSQEGSYHAIEFNEEKKMTPEEKKRTFMEALKDFFGFDPKEIQQQRATTGKQFTEAELNAAVEKGTAPLARQLSELSAKFTESQTTAAITSMQSKSDSAVGKLKAAGKWIPAFDKMGVPAIFSALAASSVEITFGEGDKAVKKPLIQVFSEFLDGLPKIVPAGEIAKAAADTRPRVAGKVVNFNEAAGRIKVDEESVLFSEAAEKLATDKKISLGEAMRELRGSGWQSHREGQATAGAV